MPDPTEDLVDAVAPKPMQLPENSSEELASAYENLFDR